MMPSGESKYSSRSSDPMAFVALADEAFGQGRFDEAAHWISLAYEAFDRLSDPHPKTPSS